MIRRTTRCFLLLVGLLTTFEAGLQTADAQLLARLFPRLAARRALRRGGWVAYYPVTPVTAANPTVALRYVPQTRFRTVWASVPVTQYRPVTWNDPTTGSVVTAMRPCSTYTWQARRVAYTAYVPVYQPAVAPSPTSSVCQVGVPAVMAMPSAAATIPAVGSTVTPGIVGGSGLSAPSGAGCAPSAVATPWTAVPRSPSIPSVTAPPTGMPSSPAGPGAGGQPAASQPPRLNPEDLPNAREGVPTDNEGSVPNSEPNGYTEPNAYAEPNGYETNRMEAPGALSQGVSTNHRGIQDRPAGAAPEPVLKPIPVPRRRPNTWDPDSLPRLINPQDQTAGVSIPQRWDAIPIAWSQPVPEPARSAPPLRRLDGTSSSLGEPAREYPARERPAREREEGWDDTGWRSSSAF